MPLPSAGSSISFSQLNEELGNSAEAEIDLKSASEGLGEDAAPYGMDELQGLSFGRILQSIGYLDYEAQEADPSVTEDTAVPYIDGELHLAAGAEDPDSNIDAISNNYYNSDGGFSNGDILYLNNTGLTFPDFPSSGLDGLESDGYLVNKTSNKVFYYTRSTSAVSNVIDRTPVTMTTPTLSVVGSSIRITIPNHETRVVKNYVIQRKTNSGGTFATLATISPSAFGNYSNTSVTTTYDDSSVVAGTNNYFYRVKATNAFDETAYVNSNPTSENIPAATEPFGSRPTLVANYYGYDAPGSFEIYTFTNSQLIQAAENDISGFFGGNADSLNKTVYHSMNNNAIFDTGDYLYATQYSAGTPSASIDWTDPDNHGANWDDTSNFVNGYMVDTTNDVIFKVDILNGEVLALRSRTPSTPNAPEDAGGATSTSVDIQFTSNTEVTDTFKVYKSTTSGGTYTEHPNKSISVFSRGSDTDTSTTVTITVNGLSSSTGYFFKVAGVNDFVTGTQSNNNDFAISTSAGGGGGCFAYGTQILMADGTTKNIEEIMVGDVVKSMSIPGMPIVDGTDDDWNTYKDFTTNSLVSSSLSTATVRKAVTDSYDNYYKITLGNGDILKATYEHPLFVQRDGVYKWVKVNHTEVSSSLKTTDLLVDKDKNTQTISSIDFVDEILDVGTIDVEDLDVYFANNYLVHNAEGGK